VAVSYVRAEGDQSFTKADLLGELAAYLAELRAVDDVKLKIDLIEQAEPERSAVLTVKFILDYSGAFPPALLDDFTKGLPTDEQIKLLLTQRLKKGATFHGLYIGVQRIAMAGAVVMTAIRLPSCIQTDMQLARRVIHVDLSSGARGARVEWDKTCGGNITGWRGRQRQNTEACDMLLSELKDQFFCLDIDPALRARVEETFGPYTTTFFEAAQKLGFSPVIGVKGENDPYAELRDLFHVACAEPDTVGSHFQGRGWKVLHLDKTTPYHKAFEEAHEACDANINDPNTWESIESCQWADVLGVKGIEFKFRKHGKRVGMKWGDRSFNDPNVKLNQEIEGVQPGSGWIPENTGKTVAGHTPRSSHRLAGADHSSQALSWRPTHPASALAPRGPIPRR
jgi:hypothetical protein